jgi:hypothetical protein
MATASGISWGLNHAEGIEKILDSEDSAWDLAFEGVSPSSIYRCQFVLLVGPSHIPEFAENYHPCK